MRTLPLSAVTAALPRALRDTARTAGKQAELVVVGARYRARPRDPRRPRRPVHAPDPQRRRARDRAPAERARAGKPASGTRRASRRPARRVGRDRRRGRRSRRACGGARRGAPDRIARRCPDPAGYSTAAEVTELAGRGVGLDAVARPRRGIRRHARDAKRDGVGTRDRLCFRSRSRCSKCSSSSAAAMSTEFAGTGRRGVAIGDPLAARRPARISSAAARSASSTSPTSSHDVPAVEPRARVS